MRTLKANFSLFIFLLASCIFSTAQAQNSFDANQKWNAERAATPSELLADDAPTPLDKVKMIYTALEEGDPNTIISLVATDIVWNGNTGLPFSDGNPHIGSSALLEMAFNRIGALCTNYMIYDLTYQVSTESITVKGNYQAYYVEKLVMNTFVHIWSVKKGEIVGLQHYENMPYEQIAKNEK